jgi:hypothetical protein
MITKNRIGGVMISVFVASAIHLGFEARSGQTKDYNKNVDTKFSAHDAFLE